jgi:hypothetical protein
MGADLWEKRIIFTVLLADLSHVVEAVFVLPDRIGFGAAHRE